MTEGMQNITFVFRNDPSYKNVDVSVEMFTGSWLRNTSTSWGGNYKSVIIAAWS